MKLVNCTVELITTQGRIVSFITKLKIYPKIVS